MTLYAALGGVAALMVQISPTPVPPPPGGQDPVLGAIAIGTIAVVAIAGLWLYRVIRKGL
jgi:hypothetical protein